MINFILYEDEEKFRDLYFSIIDNYFKNSKIAYEINELSKYDETSLDKLNKIGDNRVYILDIEVPGKSGLDFARDIRNSGDYRSQIIIVTTHDNLKDYDMLSEMLTLAFISKFYDIKSILTDKIKKAYEILTSDKILEFQRKGRIYQVPINEILYIEKQFNEDGVIIVTKNDRYKTNFLISEIEEKLNYDPRFYRVNRACVINLNKVRMYDRDQEVIEFTDNEYVDIISKAKKGELKRLLSKNQIKSRMEVENSYAN